MVRFIKQKQMRCRKYLGVTTANDSSDKCYY